MKPTLRLTWIVALALSLGADQPAERPATPPTQPVTLTTAVGTVSDGQRAVAIELVGIFHAENPRHDGWWVQIRAQPTLVIAASRADSLAGLLHKAVSELRANPAAIFEESGDAGDTWVYYGSGAVALSQSVDDGAVNTLKLDPDHAQLLSQILTRTAEHHRWLTQRVDLSR